MKKTSECLLLTLLFAGIAQADVRLPNVFDEHMVLQREMKLPVWGWADPGEKVTVAFAGQSVAATADKDGKWRVMLAPLQTSAVGREFKVTGKNSIVLKDVLVGEVWLCGGQSNMESELNWCCPEDGQTADIPLFRIVKADHVLAPTPQDDVKTRRWMICEPGKAMQISGTGFYFARKLVQELKIPVGLLDTSWGGSNITFWIPVDSYKNMPALRPQWEKETALAHAITKEFLKGKSQDKEFLEKNSKWMEEARKSLDTPDIICSRVDGMPERREFGQMYNGLVHPFAPYAIRGLLWYQGEYNANDGDYYVDEMKGLIEGWRKTWGQGLFPAYFVQLPNHQAPTNDPVGGDGWANIRNAQAKTMATVPNTGMIVTIDVGENEDIHPKNKLDVGERLALWALAKNYDKKIVYSSPFFKEFKVERNKIRIIFDSVGSGLMVGNKDGKKPAVEDKGGKLQRFAIAGADRKWFWADAVIDGATVVASSPDVPKPVAVRYAYSMNPEGCNLYNKNGLPAGPFRTDDW
jgi:sialate O-acetylesterase